MNAIDDFYKTLIKNWNCSLKKKLVVCTDCAGIESPLIALNVLNIPYTHLFSSDIDSNCLKFIKENFNPKHLIKDLKTRDNKLFLNSEIDLYVAGFPCQTFSSLGKNLGFDDKIKGTIFFDVYDFIKRVQPNIFILENVKALTTHDKGKTFKIIMDSLNDLNIYNINYEVLNTKDYGIPQSRSRIYIVGIKKSLKKNFNFPTKMNKTIPIDSLLLNLPKDSIIPRNKTLLDEIEKRYPLINFNDTKNPWLLNLNVSSLKWFRRGTKGISPCLLTNSKFYIPSLKRYLTPIESLLLQGIPVNDYKFDYPDSVLFKFSGNTMSVNILVLLFMNLFA
jgi:DNA (cytosine-5)-methyltransferase 1